VILLKNVLLLILVKLGVFLVVCNFLNDWYFFPTVVGFPCKLAPFIGLFEDGGMLQRIPVIEEFSIDSPWLEKSTLFPLGNFVSKFELPVIQNRKAIMKF
jgi:hypothetical protein